MKNRLLSVSLAASMFITSAGMAVRAQEPETAGDSQIQAAPEQEQVPVETEVQTPAEQTDQDQEAEEAEDASAETDIETATEESALTEQETQTSEVLASVQEAAADQTEAAPMADDAEGTGDDNSDPSNPYLDDGQPKGDPRDRVGSDVSCSLTLDTKVDGNKQSILTFDPDKDQYEIQVGGLLNLKNVWSKYNTFKLAYIAANGKDKFREKSLVGTWSYYFHVNPEVVTVNESVLTNHDSWQKAFEEASGASAATFFSYMKCSGASYDPATGKVTVDFRIDENGTGKVSVATIEDGVNTGSKPQTIEAYSPAGGLFIKAENFKKGADAVTGEADFAGEIDLDPWMTLIFPIRFDADTIADTLSLEVPDARVSFSVKNGTWADGTDEPIVVSVPMDVQMTKDGPKAVGTLSESLIPTGMLALKEFNQKKGAWQPELNTSENGVIYTGKDQDAASYIYTFEKEAEPIPAPTPAPGQKPVPTPQTKPTTQNSANKKPGTPATGVATDALSLMGFVTAGLSGLVTLFRRRNK